MDATEAEAEALLQRLGPKRRARPRTAAALLEAEHRLLDTPAGQIAAWRLDHGRVDAPAVLLVHGWEDDNSLWGPLIDSLAEMLEPVVVLDLPGHGFSPAEGCNHEAAVQAIRAAVEAFGPVHAVVGHSFGCAVLVKALAEGAVEASRAVLIAPPRPWSGRNMIDRLVEEGASPAAAERALALRTERDPQSAVAYDMEDDLPKMTAEALFIHSADDPLATVEAVERYVSLWPGARLSLTDGLGHRLVAQDAAEVQRMREFLIGI